MFFDTFAQLAERMGAQRDSDYIADHQDFSWLDHEIDRRIFALVPEAEERRAHQYEAWRGK
ncbi:hypothetical protein LGT39_01340 [Demequina sp. TTPB684]|uniref:hypothetical protein n=1 Tax=unclassified Demequina TaxID=2620311 RepID=UPI001CF10F7B|nr:MULTISPECIES: hypothetical protein [unclassified Demequina]MCB2411491.1 hypothetical protein [Demequina sp. TTPB684]UPU88104.1 hypothetical protein LGT36_012775 [Demequina sp. TMPB413]